MLTRWFFFFQAEDGIRDSSVTGVQTCALPIYHFSPQREDFLRGRDLRETRVRTEPCIPQPEVPCGLRLRQRGAGRKEQNLRSRRPDRSSDATANGETCGTVQASSRRLQNPRRRVARCLT